MPAVRCRGWGRWLTSVVRMDALPPWIMLALPPRVVPAPGPPGIHRVRSVRCLFRGRIDEHLELGRVYVFEAEGDAEPGPAGPTGPTGNTV